MPQSAVTFVTGADERYSRALYQFLRSAERHGYHCGDRWLAYDLGMAQDTRGALEQRFGWCEFRSFDFAAYPPHVALERGSYAWKPLIFREVMAASEGAVCWFDSATVFKGDLSPMLDTIARTGVYALNGQAPMSERCEPAVLERLDFPRHLYATRERFAGLFGADASNPAAVRLVEEWSRLALDPEIIRPHELTIPRHMNDQAVLSCVLLAAADRGEIVLGDEDVDISSPRPIRFLSTRNKVPTWMPRWADPLVRARYAVWKRLDQLAHRIRRV